MALQFGRSRLPELLGKMSQAQFAKRIEVSEAYVSQIIKGKTTFSLLKAKHASDVLNCTIEDLYEWIPETKGKRL